MYSAETLWSNFNESQGLYVLCLLIKYWTPLCEKKQSSKYFYSCCPYLNLVRMCILSGCFQNTVLTNVLLSVLCVAPVIIVVVILGCLYGGALCACMCFIMLPRILANRMATTMYGVMRRVPMRVAPVRPRPRRPRPPPRPRRPRPRPRRSPYGVWYSVVYFIASPLTHVVLLSL